MKIANIITVSTYSAFYNAFEERQIWIVRPYRITHRGAERILRKMRTLGAHFGAWNGSVVRIEASILA
jgi:hypothetical protein